MRKCQELNLGYYFGRNWKLEWSSFVHLESLFYWKMTSLSWEQGPWLPSWVRYCSCKVSCFISDCHHYIDNPSTLLPIQTCTVNSGSWGCQIIPHHTYLLLVPDPAVSSPTVCSLSWPHFPYSFIMPIADVSHVPPGAMFSCACTTRSLHTVTVHASVESP